MWAWYRNEYVIPLIDEWEGYPGNGVLPIEQHGQVFVTKMFQPQGNTCKNMKAISTGGDIEDLCTYCAKSFERFVNPNAVCKFAYDRNSDNYFGWSEDDVALLTSGIEIPALALCKGDISNANFSLTRTGVDGMSFTIGRIIENLRKMRHNLSIWHQVKTDPSTNFYATRSVGMRPHSWDAWNLKNDKLMKKLQKLDRSELKASAAKLLV